LRQLNVSMAAQREGPSLLRFRLTDASAGATALEGIMHLSRFLSYAFAAGLAVATISAQQEAMARSASFSRSFSTPRGTFTQTGTASFNPSTRAASSTVTTTGPKGKTKTLSFASAPDGKGGVTATRSFTGFNGHTHTVTRQIGP
jgi:hypothetical protein